MQRLYPIRSFLLTAALVAIAFEALHPSSGAAAGVTYKIEAVDNLGRPVQLSIGPGLQVTGITQLAVRTSSNAGLKGLPGTVWVNNANGQAQAATLGEGLAVTFSAAGAPTISAKPPAVTPDFGTVIVCPSWQTCRSEVSGELVIYRQEPPAGPGPVITEGTGAWSVDELGFMYIPSPPWWDTTLNAMAQPGANKSVWMRSSAPMFTTTWAPVSLPGAPRR